MSPDNLFMWVNHTENYVHPKNPEVHTQRIELTWFRVKRGLPRGGNYSLQDHLPVFLWKLHIRQQGLEPFSELLRLIADPRYSLIREACEPVEFPKKLDFPCLYCSSSFSTEKGMKIHLGKCKREEQPKETPAEVFPCSTCDEIFNDHKKYKV